jgi:hypothetical protein
MVVACNVCPGASKAIVWFKFADKPWISYKPTTFPFAYETINNNDGTWTIRFFKRSVINPVRGHPFFNYNDLLNGGSNTYGLASIPGGAYGWGDPNNFFFEPFIKVLSQFNQNWYVRLKDVCGYSIEQPLSTSSGGKALSAIRNTATVSGSSVWVSIITLNNPGLAPNASTCSQCPSGWEQTLGTITSQGQPQIQITCNADKCPPDTACECDCGHEVCCYNAQGTPVYSYLKQ